VVRLHRAPEWTFINYGYAATEADEMPLDPSDAPNRHWIQLYDHVAGAVDLQGSTVLEVGSGRGGGTSFIKRYLKPARVIGLDLSKSAVDLSNGRHRIDGLEFRVGDAENLPFEDNSFDAVVNVESSHCYPDLKRFLSEVRRVLRPGGHFLYADFRDRGNAESWRRNLQDCGLSLRRETDITSQVVTALDRDNERKLALIDRIVPRPLRASFLDFAAVRGSTLFEGFQSGEFSYRSFVLQKPLP
jgi:ubiquinone/menaquinone biosynthesis C-methylase UbiE